MIAFFRKVVWLRRRREKDAELREELEFHLAEETERQIAAGLSAEAARSAARRELGNFDLIQDDTRSAWGWPFLDQLGQDLHYAFRAMKSSRLFTLLAMLTLALGIGANTAIFSFLDAILIRSLPAADPQSLVVLKWHTKTERDTVMHGMSTGASSDTYEDPQAGATGGIFPYPAFELLQKQNNDSVFSTVFAFESAFADSLNVSIKGEPQLHPGVFVSAEYFSGLGVSPEAGRLILPEDDRTGAPAVAVISYSLSQARFGGPANAIGQSILVDNLPFTVVGVTPKKFFGVDPRYNPSIYLPFRTNLLLGAANPFGLRPKDYLAQNFYWVQIMARLRPGVSLQQAQAALGEPFHQWVLATAGNDQERANLPQLFVHSAATGLDSLRRDYSRSLYLLLAIVALILLLACANVANLLLARAASRRREIALRLSIGAGRRRILRQLLTESLLLASASGVLGILFAFWGIRFLALLMANGRNDFPVRAELNWHVLVVAVVLSLLTGIVFGLAPALQATKVDVLPSLKESRGTRATTRRDFRRFTLSNGLVAGQIAVSMLLLVAAGLFLRTLSNLQSIHLGFNRENVLLFRFERPQGRTQRD